MIGYRPDPGLPAARVLVDLERLAVTRAELTSATLHAILREPALPLTDLSQLQVIACDDGPVPPDCADLLGVRVEEPSSAPPTALPEVGRDRLKHEAMRAADLALTDVDLDCVLQASEDLEQAALLSMLRALEITSTATDLNTVLAPVARAHRPLVERWLRALADHGLIDDASGDGTPRQVRATRTVSESDVLAAWDQVDRSWSRSMRGDTAAPPAGAGSLTLEYARSSAEHLRNVLRGTTSAMSLLFPDGRLDVAAAIYREPPVTRYQMAAVAGFVATLADSIPSDRPLRILEVGGGTAATTERVLEALEGHAVDYLFTDVGTSFLEAAQDRFGTSVHRAPRFRAGRFDIDGGPEQGIGQRVDVVIAGAVLNNARDTHHSLRLLADQVAENGWLLITEPTREVQWIAMSQAFLMTSAVDDRQQTGATFLSHEQWRAAFDRAGLEEVLDLPPEDHPLSEAGQRFFAVQPSFSPSHPHRREEH